MAMKRMYLSLLAMSLVQQAVAAELTFPPRLPGGKTVVTDRSPRFLRRNPSLKKGVDLARSVPTVDFLYYPQQTYAGRPWSVWGDSLAVGGKYYSAIGDHLAPQGNAFVYEYDPVKKSIRTLVNLKKTLKLPKGHYAPGKIHSRIDVGRDGWLYFATHRGSTRVTTDRYHYKGDWIIRHHPRSGKTGAVTPLEEIMRLWRSTGCCLVF